MSNRLTSRQIRQFANSAVVVALIVASLGWLTQCQQTREAQRLSYQMQQVSAFKDSGSKLDAAVVDVFDNLADGKDVEGSRLAFNQAVKEHIIRTENDRIIFGDRDADEYLKALRVLRSEVEIAEDARNSGARVTAFADVVEKRRSLMKIAVGS